MNVGKAKGKGKVQNVKVGIVFALDRRNGSTTVFKTVTLNASPAGPTASTAKSAGPQHPAKGLTCSVLATLAEKFAASVRASLPPRRSSGRCLRLSNRAVVQGSPLPVLLNPTQPFAICHTRPSD